MARQMQARVTSKALIMSVPHELQAYKGSRPDDLWEVTEHLDTVLNCVTDHAIITLDEAGNINGWNSGAERVKGYAREEIIGQHFSCFYTKADQEDGLPLRVLRMATETGKHECEGWRVRKDGEKFWANVVIHPLTTFGGKLRGFVKITRDVSQRLQMDKLREELNQSQKLELVGQLTGGVAHDFNNFLTAIAAGNELIQTYCEDSRVTRVMEINKLAVESSRKLVSQLLAFSRRQIMSPKRSNVWDLVTTLDVLIHRAAGEQVRLRWNLQPELPAVNVDPAQFQSVLLNLVVNARDAMPDGGWLTVFMEKLVLLESNYPPPYNLPAGEYVVLGVSDTGTGMSDEVRERAIEPFFTTKDVGRGTGLGLSQSFGFARQSGGTLRIESVLGRGTTVRIILPAIDAAPATHVTPLQKTILFVDDDSAIRTLVCEMLRFLGHKVVEAEDGREALALLEHDHTINFLFTDIVMPNDMSGLQLMNAARLARPGLPTLLASGYPRDVLRNLGDIPEDVCFIPKPYTLADISAHVGARHTLH
jgi:PAS domain S-box-containing protein